MKTLLSKIFAPFQSRIYIVILCLAFTTFLSFLTRIGYYLVERCGEFDTENKLTLLGFVILIEVLFLVTVKITYNTGKNSHEKV